MSHSPAAAAALLIAAAAAPVLAQDARPPQDGMRHDEAERLTRRLYETHRPAVFNVRVTTRAHRVPRLLFPGLRLAMPGSLPEQVEGTGFLLSQDGFVATTYACIRNAAHFEVRGADGKLRDARLVGADEPFQMAVLRTAHSDAEPVAWAGRVPPERGTVGWFFQAGCDQTPDFQFAPVRVAEQSQEDYDRYLYSVLPLADGAAGGPLLSADGRLLGMAVGAVRRRASAGDGEPAGPESATLFVQGEDIVAAARQIVGYGSVRRPMLGVVMDRETNRIDQLLPGGPAERAGLEEGDRVVELAGQRIGSLVDVTRTLLRRRAGERVRVELERNGTRVLRQVTLTEHGVPPLPETPPLADAVLELLVPAAGEGEREVIVFSVEPGSVLHLAGVQPGDELISVDGVDVLRFLARHRIHPASSQPRTLEVERDGRRVPIDLER